MTDENITTQNTSKENESAAMSRPEYEAFIKKPEVARRLNKTVRTVDNLLARRMIPVYRVGRSVLFRWSEIEAHLAATCRVPGRGGK